MDSLSQVVLGAAIAEVAVGKKMGRSALLLGAALGTLPDLDVLVAYTDAVASYTYHRSWSHSLLTLSLVSFVIAYALQRWFPHRWIKPDANRFNQGSQSRTSLSATNESYVAEASQMQYSDWLRVSGLVLITHPILDGFTVYGTQILWPLPMQPTAWGSMFIIDPIYTLPLLFAVVVAWKNRNSALKACGVGLLISTAYIAVTLSIQNHVKRLAISSLHELNVSSERVLLAPTPLSLLWRTVIIDGEFYFEGFYSVFDSDKRIKFKRYDSHRNEIESNYNRWTVGRLDWFTKGFISASIKDERLIINDLRMGVEGSYIFRFDVGPIGIQAREQSLHSTQLPISINTQRVKSLVSRTFDQNHSID